MFLSSSLKKKASLSNENKQSNIGVHKCSCGKPIIKGGECAECKKKREEKQNASLKTPVANNMGTVGTAMHKFSDLSVHSKTAPRLQSTGASSTSTQMLDGNVSNSGMKWIADIKSISYPFKAKGGMLSDGPADLASEDEMKIADEAPTFIPGPAAGVTAPVPPPPVPMKKDDCTYKITYSNIQKPGCPAGKCGAKIIYDVSKVEATGATCPSLKGLKVTESVTTDNGCTPGGVKTGAGCDIGDNGEVKHCTDTYAFCTSGASIKEGGCTEIYTQQLFVGGVLAETRTITFKFTKSGETCSGTVDRT